MTDHNETQDGDDRHKDTGPFAEGHGVNLDEGLWGVEGEKRVEVGRAEQKQDSRCETEDTRRDRRRDDSTPSNNTMMQE